MIRRTQVSIQAEKFFINGAPTYADRIWNGLMIEGLLLNAKMSNGIFDDRNFRTASKWAYPDTGRWNAIRHTEELVAAMPQWRKHGLLAFTLNLQGASPEGLITREHPWHNSAFDEDGALNPAYMQRLERILDEADWQRMVVILGLFHHGQDERLQNEAAVRRAVLGILDWLYARQYRNVLIEVADECDHPGYKQGLLQAERIHELLQVVKAHEGRFLCSASFTPGRVPPPRVMELSDFVLLHATGLSSARRVTQMVDEARWVEGYRPMPVLITEDDHTGFDESESDLKAALESYASWGWCDFDGFQKVPVGWMINTDRKRAFFAALQEIAGIQEGR